MSRFKVLVADKLSQKGVELLRSREEFDVDVRHGLSEDELATAARDAHAILVRSDARVTARVVEEAAQLRAQFDAARKKATVDVRASCYCRTVET